MSGRIPLSRDESTLYSTLCNSRRQFLDSYNCIRSPPWLPYPRAISEVYSMDLGVYEVGYWTHHSPLRHLRARHGRDHARELRHLRFGSGGSLGVRAGWQVEPRVVDEVELRARISRSACSFLRTPWTVLSNESLGWVGSMIPSDTVTYFE